MLDAIRAESGTEPPSEWGALAQASEWHVLVHASSLIFNNKEWMCVPTIFQPRFHDSVVIHGLSPDDLLARCMKKLWPLMNAAVSDVYDADGNSNIEQLFNESEFFDCLSHLAALASHPDNSLPRSSGVALELIDTEQAGLSATVTSHVLTGRDTESSRLDACLQPVFTLDDSASHCKFVLIHGIPGTGKSLLADSALSRLDTTYKECGSAGAGGRVVEEYSFKIQARKRDSVRDGLHKMGLSLCGKLGIGSAASFEDVLGSDMKPPRLRQFLQRNRFVILADDADEDGLHELLLHLPRSSKPCAVIVTSQYGESLMPHINRSDHKADLIAIELQCFEPDVSLELVEAICCCSEYSALRSELHPWLTQVLEQLGQLPLVVRVFAEWLHQELTQSLPEGLAFDLAGLQCRWRQEYEKDDGDTDGILGSVVGSRGLRATVRLALHNLHKLKSPEEYEAIRQVLGLLALCPPVNVPWSLFDGVSLVSAMGQACKVRREDADGGVVLDDAEVVSDKVIKGGESVVVRLHEGGKKIVSRSNVVFGLHIAGMIVKDERYQVQLLTPQPYMRGARVELHGFSKAVTNNGLQGRVMQLHADDGSVSVVFGCETGACCTAATCA